MQEKDLWEQTSDCPAGVEEFAFMVAVWGFVLSLVLALQIVSRRTRNQRTLEQLLSRIP